MTNILILPEEGDSYRAVSGDKESTGRTPGQALDALRSQLTEEESGTLVIVQDYKPDRFFDAAQQERLAELKQLRDAGSLTAEDEEELESLVEVELRGATQRAESMSTADVQKVPPPPRPLPGRSHIARVTQESFVHAQEVSRQIMTQTRNYDLAVDVVAIAIPRVVRYARRYGPTQETWNVKTLLTITARNLLIDAQTKELMADELESAGRDRAADDSLPNLSDRSPANEFKQGAQDPYLERIARECMACKAEVEGRISSADKTHTLAEDIVAQAIQRVIEYAARHRGEKEIENVKGFLMATARNLLIDAQTKKSKAARIAIASWDDAANSGLLGLPDESSADKIQRRIEATELKELVLTDATLAERELFDMWFEGGMTPAEISVQLGIGPATVRHRMQTLLTRMRLAIEKSGLL